MAQSVKLADEVMALVRREAELHSRSVAGQITHWLKIGRAIERSGSYDHASITAALAGRLDTTRLRDGDDGTDWAACIRAGHGNNCADGGQHYSVLGE